MPWLDYFLRVLCFLRTRMRNSERYSTYTTTRVLERGAQQGRPDGDDDDTAELELTIEVGQTELRLCSLGKRAPGTGERACGAWTTPNQLFELSASVEHEISTLKFKLL